MFACKAGAYRSETPNRCSLSLASPSILRRDWKSLPMTNALAYYAGASMMTIEFYNIETSSPLKNSVSSWDPHLATHC
jgi:hypothetical protein